MLISAVAVLHVAPPVYAVASLSLSPATLTDTCTLPPPGAGCTNGLGEGNTFQYAVTAAGVGGSTSTVFAFQYEIHYNPSIIQGLSIDSFGAFFDTLIGIGSAICPTSIDNLAGIVSIACSSTGPQSPSFATTLSLGTVTFNVTGLARSDQTLENAILLHNSGGGVLTNIPVTTTGALFSNTGLFGIADFPSVTSGLRAAWPEAVQYGYAQDVGFTPGIETMFGNVNSTGTLPVVVYIVFDITTPTGAMASCVTSTHQYGPGEVSVVPQFTPTCYNPNPTGNNLQIGTYDVVATLFYRQVNLDNSLGTLTAGVTQKPFHFTVTGGEPTTTSVSCSPATGVTRRTTCTAVVLTSDQPHLNGVVAFSSNVAGIFKPLSCAPDNHGICSVRFYPRAMGDANVTASYSGDTGGKNGHAGSSASTIVSVSGHPTSLAVACVPSTGNAPKRTFLACTVTVTDTTATPDNVNGVVVFKSSKASYWDFAQNVPGNPFIFPTCTLSPTNVTGVSSCILNYRPTRSNSALGTATIDASYGVSNRPGSEVPDSSAPADADHLTSAGSTTVTITGHPTRTTVKCSPGLVSVNMTTTCTATVTDIIDPVAGVGSVSPSGIVLWVHGNGGSGTGGFTPTNSCTLSPIAPDSVGQARSSCSVTFTATAISEVPIFGLYRGDTVGDGHTRTTGAFTLKVTA